MEMWLSVEAPTIPGEDSTIVVDATSTNKVAELLAHLDGDGAPSDARWYVERSGAVLEPTVAIESIDLRSGDRLVRSRPIPPGTDPPRAVLVIASGPEAGRRIALEDGSWTIGRDRDNDLCIDDSALSRHHATLHVDGGSATIADARSANGTFVAGQPAEHPLAIGEGAPIELGRTVLRIESGGHATPAAVHTSAGAGAFNRPPRRTLPDPGVDVSLPTPPPTPTPRRIPLISALAPLVIAPVLVLIGDNWTYLLFMALSPVMLLASYWEERRHGGQERAEKQRRFDLALADATSTLSEGIPLEATTRWERNPDPAEIVARACRPLTTLWERRRADADFARVRVGWADLPSVSRIAVPSEGDPAQLRRVDALRDTYGVAPAVPVTIDLPEVGAIGLVGQAVDVADTGRWLIAQLAVLQSPRDLQIIVLLADDKGWEWVRSLPHTGGRSRPAVAVGAESARVLIDRIDQMITARQEQANETLAGRVRQQQTVVVVDERLDVPRRAVGRLLEDGPAVEVNTVWLGSDAPSLPGEIGAIVTARAGNVDVLWPRTGGEVLRAGADLLPRSAAVTLARRLEGLRDVSERGSAAELPTRVDIGDVLDLDSVTSSMIADRWRASSGIAGPLGVSGAGTATIDLRRDGPHALLGGTTGAGKSELLQTLVAGLAATHPPERLTFLLVDYKGGAAFKDCRDLPHTVGMVTDLDGHLVHRVLRSLNAELTRRERVLASAGAKDLEEMERTTPGLAPPSLLLIVDEFATLAAELPEFVDGVVNIAQRGRSLGIHLVLATQRPAGAINDNIRANTNLRISLRMNDASDSEDVIGTAAAAQLSRNLPGRALVRTGAGEITEVQVAYAGGHGLTDGTGATAPLRVGVAGPRGVAWSTTTSTDEPDPTGPTDLQALVAAISDAAAGTPAPHAPWLPALGELIALEDLEPVSADLAVPPAIGLRDDPDGQSQHPHRIDLPTCGSLLVVGASGSGKTTTLRSLAVSLATRHSPDDLHLYALDFASRGLGVLAELPHCGAVIPGTDQERVVRLLSTIEREMQVRRSLLAEHSATTIDELPPNVTPPRIVVLLEGVGAYVQELERIEYGRWVDRLVPFTTDGRPLGIHWVLTADRRLSMPFAVSSAIAERLVLRLADRDDYDALGIARTMVGDQDLPPGRAFDGASREVQIGVVGGASTGEAQIRAVAEIARDLWTRFPSASVPSIRVLPDEIAVAELEDIPGEPWIATVGIEAEHLGNAKIDMSDDHALVVGPSRSGVSTAIATVVRSLHGSTPGLKTILLAPRRSPLTDSGPWDRTLVGVDEIDDTIDDLAADLADDDGPTLVVIDDYEDLVDGLSDPTLERLARRGLDGSLRFVVGTDRASAHSAYSGLLAELRRSRSGLLLQPDADSDGELFGTPLDRTWGGGPTGRGVLVTDGRPERVQVAR